MSRSVAFLLLFGLLAGALAPAAEAPEFAYPQPGRQFAFPRDHGSHPEFKIEWWYLTGHLYSRAEPSRRFGFQATFFRQAGDRPGLPDAEPAETFAPAPFYLAHMAVVDVATGKFVFQERLNRAGWDAGASVTTLAVRNGNWSLALLDAASGAMRLLGSVRSEAALQLTLTPAQPLTLFGQEGVSRKGADPHSASHYLTFARLRSEGSLRLAGQDFAVTGEAWMDHEISSSQLTPGQVGWDWAALQLRDGREIMAYRMRLADGSTDRFSTLAWVDDAGKARHFGPEEFTWKPVSTWKSPHSGATYPTEVVLTSPDPQHPGQTATFHLQPLVADQELVGGVGGVSYWEGACRVLDAEKREIGSAYLELTGYAGPLSGVR